MKSLNGKQLARLAEERGWQLVRISGSHHIYAKEGRIERLTIPIHGNQGLKSGLQRALMRIIPLSHEEL